jgi:hypothetical protein
MINRRRHDTKASLEMRKNMEVCSKPPFPVVPAFALRLTAGSLFGAALRPTPVAGKNVSTFDSLNERTPRLSRNTGGSLMFVINIK